MNQLVVVKISQHLQKNLIAHKVILYVQSQYKKFILLKLISSFLIW